VTIVLHASALVFILRGSSCPSVLRPQGRREGNADALLLREFPRLRWFDFAHHPELVEGRDLKTIPEASEIIVDKKPVKAGIDPYVILIHRERDNNLVQVKRD
jgi:hypothetical protein